MSRKYWPSGSMDEGAESVLRAEELSTDSQRGQPMMSHCTCRITHPLIGLNGTVKANTPVAQIINDSEIEYCSTHAAAPAMREALKKVLHQEINSREIENVLRIVEINQ